MKNIITLFVAILFLSCSTQKTFTEKIDKEGIQGEIITTIIPSKNKSCKEEIIVNYKTNNLDEYAITLSVSGGKIQMKKGIFHIEPSCKIGKFNLIMNYRIDDKLIRIQQIDLSEFIKN